ncbi:MAG: DUF1987 domain-containing protein [Cytophagales bacterium]|nr:DUF1987 domain-containing protein [Bernardetiaceae bacterium]MDW8210797.1 DUF1987 domain-containing protein [Cytophagales bacterium]
MENFYSAPDIFIPEINFNAQTGHLSISGESYHEYTLEFYKPVFEWLSEYLKTPGRHIVFDFCMSYYNTSTSRRFMEIFDLLAEYQQSGKGTVTINWYYKPEDIDMKESGEEYAEDTGLHFNLIPLTK